MFFLLKGILSILVAIWIINQNSAEFETNFLAVRSAEIMVWLSSFVDKIFLNCSVIAALARSVISFSFHLAIIGYF